MKAHLSYLRYVLRHKWFVFLAGLETGAPIWRLIIHDWTKFLPCEWGSYARYFYDGRGDRIPFPRLTNEGLGDFNQAWNHHQKVNPHHWQSWVLMNDWDEPKYQPLEMPLWAIREMVADWVGAGRAITGKIEVWSWYEKNRDKIMLHEKTRKEVEFILEDLSRCPHTFVRNWTVKP